MITIRISRRRTSRVASAPRSIRAAVQALIVAALAMLLLPTSVSAHPLGNFTINHYSGLRVAADRVLVDHVIDFAEIPTFQERLAMDRAGDGDGSVSDAEAAAYRDAACIRQADSLRLDVRGTDLALTIGPAALQFPPGQAGAPTQRLVCSYTATFAAPLGGATPITFSDSSYPERIGWREIVVQGDGTTVTGDGLATDTISQRLTSYPTDLLAEPLRQTSVSFTVAPGGPTLAPYSAPELAAGARVAPVTGVGGTGGPATPAAASGSCASASSSLPGGSSDIGIQICELVQARDLTPVAVALSLLAAAFIGALHAVSPGHGKTVMAAYLVGAGGGGLRHAVGLGLTVTISHTIGVLALGGLTIFASALLPPDRLQLYLGVASGLILLVLGLYLVWSRVREMRRERGRGSSRTSMWGRPAMPALAYAGGTAGAAHGHEHEAATAHSHGGPHEHEHEHEPGAAHEHEHEPGDEARGYHSHGIFRHTHIPEELPDGGLSWRALFALGLSGGLVPSASAVIVLLVSISLGRPAYGVVLTMAFGLGMAIVLIGIGLALVYARGLLERMPHRARFASIARWVPLATAGVVLVVGFVVTAQALSQFR